MKKFKRVLVANRGEIAIRIFRACKEMGIRSVAIYSNEDKNSLFRTKADESYLIGKNKGPVDAYLDIDEIIKLAKKKGVDAIHPGYGFLSENPEFPKKCKEAGIEFIGPTSEMMINLGDKLKSKMVANAVNVPTIPGVEKPINTDEEAIEYANFCGYPVILKAAAGGGGRGMRIVREEKDLLKEFRSAKNEAKAAFGIDDIFIEKYLEKPKHIEVQILGDKHGNMVHLFERDCSIQRRHQKLIEFTPAFSLDPELRERICQDALRIAGHVDYCNAGTVEFLVDANGNHYFIEMNPRIQVEHTVSEMVTGIDIVQSQIYVAMGYTLDSDVINIKSQEDVTVRGFSIQCRITTEDPKNSFAPDNGKIDMYRTDSGFGIRLDGGNGFTGAEISPYYDSLLVKVTSWSRSFQDAINKSIRSIKELKVRGVKTNAAFLINVLNHEMFKEGLCDTTFISNYNDLFDIEAKEDIEYKIMKYIGDIVVNKTHGVKKDFDVPVVPKYDKTPFKGTKQILDEEGPEGVVKWIKEQNKLLLTDTTMRDAHQSLMATRVRTKDMAKIAKATNSLGRDLFSVEMWGGATFDVAYRFLNESPWERLDKLRKKMPNVLTQMLLRGSNGVGYKNYPDNVIRELIRKAADGGIDVFRIFDSLNWLKGMEVSVEEVLKTGKIAEVCMCYTGDILDESRGKYNLDYYIQLAKEIEAMGAHILGIKDMSALLKPYAAFKLIKALKEEISIPIHLHTHDTSGNGVSTILYAAEAGVDIVDTALNSMSGVTSQPALNSVVAALENTKRDTEINPDNIQSLSDYWAAVRPVYEEFESDLKSSSAEIYKYEIPGGQYSNLKPQVESFGLGHRFGEVKEMYKTVNEMFGDIIKVTPSSKAVGDMAIFMVQNDLNPENILDKGKDLAYPDSVEAFFGGMMGQPKGGFPVDLQKVVLKDEEPITVRPGELLADFDFEGARVELKEKHGIDATDRDLVSYALYPKVFDDYIKYIKSNGDFTEMGSDIFFHGLEEGETCEIELLKGKNIIVKLSEVGKHDNEGNRNLVFELNGNRREIKIKDNTRIVQASEASVLFADEDDPNEIGAPIPGKVVEILVADGEEVKENQVVAVVEAMKMETTITAPVAGTVEKVHVKVGDIIKSTQLILNLK
ncbi:MAG: pyruvate carboxylase [Firmicutes bacterium]|jgi:pyruvate carboxylase|nr:pyruvate carboxylase [Bacillota bacterium]